MFVFFTTVSKCLCQHLSPKRQPIRKHHVVLSLCAADNKDPLLEWCQGWRGDLQAAEVFKGKSKEIIFSRMFYVWNVSFIVIFIEICCFINNNQFIKDGPFHARTELIRYFLLIITSQGTSCLCSHFSAHLGFYFFFTLGRFLSLSLVLCWLISSNYQSR